jgi:hypothetical protein
MELLLTDKLAGASNLPEQQLAYILNITTTNANNLAWIAANISSSPGPPNNFAGQAVSIWSPDPVEHASLVALAEEPNDYVVQKDNVVRAQTKNELYRVITGRYSFCYVPVTSPRKPFVMVTTSGLLRPVLVDLGGFFENISGYFSNSIPYYALEAAFTNDEYSLPLKEYILSILTKGSFCLTMQPGATYLSQVPPLAIVPNT